MGVFTATGIHGMSNAALDTMRNGNHSCTHAIHYWVKNTRQNNKWILQNHRQLSFKVGEIEGSVSGRAVGARLD